MATQDFHEAAKRWARIKHGLHANYLRLFVDKTGYARPRVYCVDAFAGSGKLDDGTEGSPLYAAKIADRSGQRNGVLHCINIESDGDTFSKLESATSDFVQRGLVTNLQGTFDQRREEVLQIIGDAPAFFFIDPFGTEGAELSTLKTLKNGRAIREALIRYDDVRVRRLSSWAANNSTAISSSAQKTASAFASRVLELTDERALMEWLDRGEGRGAREALIAGYIGEARKQGIFKFGISYPIRNPDTSGHRYFLVHLCDHEDGYTFMTNFMARAEITYLEEQSEFGFQTVMPMFTVKATRLANRDSYISKVRSVLARACISREWGKGTVVPVRKALAAIVDEMHWEAHRGEWEAALKKMKSDGLVSFKTLNDNDNIELNLVP